MAAFNEACGCESVGCPPRAGFCTAGTTSNPPNQTNCKEHPPEEEVASQSPDLTPTEQSAAASGLSFTSHVPFEVIHVIFSFLPRSVLILHDTVRLVCTDFYSISKQVATGQLNDIEAMESDFRLFVQLAGSVVKCGKDYRKVTMQKELADQMQVTLQRCQKATFSRPQQREKMQKLVEQARKKLASSLV
eukprot:TRINITY_DN97138_c0_g1_i1.p1 TRINITY_DN97138_c0_g1~~TRINITY_DN97138_c0_g1_i1.p1  ORF type:complete len:190 (-),score=22.58 TRINITY_DN97138_c0_g1_i1:106-675(-)